MHFDQHFVRSVIPNAIFEGAELPDVISFSLDSRTIKKGEFFIAITGEKTDGHEFINDAIKNQARGIFLSYDQKYRLNSLSPEVKKTCSFIIVPHSHDDFLTLAAAWRNQFKHPLVGITGSIGKTFTKETLYAMARAAGKKAMCSFGNQNTALGCALNIFKLNSHHEVAFFEIGINKHGEMGKIAAMIRPTMGIITAVGHSHMEGLGSIQDIAVEKRALFAYFTEDNIGIICGDHPVLSTISYRHPVVRFGCKMTNQIQARKIAVYDDKTTFTLKIYKDRYRITIPTNHPSPLINGLAAAAAAHLLHFSHDAIISTLQNPVKVTGRFEQRPLKSRKGMIINDCYNASPESMKAALLAFEKMSVKKDGLKIAVLGDMLELGVTTPFWHRQLGRFLRKVPSVHHVILVGNHVKWAQKTLPTFINYTLVPSWKEAAEYLEHNLCTNSLVLVKGSRGLQLDNVVNAIAE